jgi:hypothetical protein
MSVLEKTLDELIAKVAGVSPDQVTLDFIRRKREENPEPRYDFNTRYGGYNAAGSRVVSPRELKRTEEKARAFLAQFAVRKEP